MILKIKIIIFIQNIQQSFVQRNTALFCVYAIATASGATALFGGIPSISNSTNLSPMKNLKELESDTLRFTTENKTRIN